MRFWLFIFVGFMLAVDGISDVKLIENGKPIAEIIIAPDSNPSVAMAANALKKYFKEMSGAELTITQKTSDGIPNKIYVGESTYTDKLGFTLNDIRHSGYKIIAKENYIIIAGKDVFHKPFPMNQEEWDKYTGEKFERPGIGPGRYIEELKIHQNDDTGSFYAATELLEQLGIRFYAQGEYGTVIPKSSDLAVAEQITKRESAYIQREKTYYGFHLNQEEATIWLKHLGYGNNMYMDGNPHGTRSLLCRKEQQAAHPEYYAMANGGMIDIDHGGKPRLLSQPFRDAYIRMADKIFQTLPALYCIDAGMPDGFFAMDEQDAKVFPPSAQYDARLSDYVWNFWLWAADELQKKYPEKYMKVLSYTTYQTPATFLKKLPDNLMLSTVIVTANTLEPYSRKYAVENRAKWLSMFSPGTKLQTYDHFLFYDIYQWPRVPVFMFKLLQEETLAVDGVASARFIESEYGYPGLEHMLYYLQGKLLWNPKLNLKALLEEYYTLYYGPAANEMKAFYEFAETVYMRPESRSITKTSGFLKEKDVDEYFRLLAVARSKVEKDSIFDKRIEQIESEMQPLKKLFPNLQRIGPDVRFIYQKFDGQLDGNLNKPFWLDWNVFYTLRDMATGESLKRNQTNVRFRMSEDRKYLLLGVECMEAKMDKIVAKTIKNDDMSIFDDDAVEVIIQTPERSYFKIVVNTNGAIYDESKDLGIVARDTMPIMWNPGVKAVVKKLDDRWMVEMAIPTEDFGQSGPTQSLPWGIQVGRTRRVNNKYEWTVLSPGGQSFVDLTRMGNLY